MATAYPQSMTTSNYKTMTDTTELEIEIRQKLMRVYQNEGREYILALEYAIGDILTRLDWDNEECAKRFVDIMLRAMSRGDGGTVNEEILSVRKRNAGNCCDYMGWKLNRYALADMANVIFLEDRFQKREDWCKFWDSWRQSTENYKKEREILKDCEVHFTFSSDTNSVAGKEVISDPNVFLDAISKSCIINGGERSAEFRIYLLQRRTAQNNREALHDRETLQLIDRINSLRGATPPNLHSAECLLSELDHLTSNLRGNIYGWIEHFRRENETDSRDGTVTHSIDAQDPAYNCFYLGSLTRKGGKEAYHLGDTRLGGRGAVIDWLEKCAVCLSSVGGNAKEREIDAQALAKMIVVHNVEKWREWEEADEKALNLLRATIGDAPADHLLRKRYIIVSSANGKKYKIDRDGEVYDMHGNRKCVRVDNEDNLSWYDKILAKYIVIRDNPSQISTLAGS